MYPAADTAAGVEIATTTPNPELSQVGTEEKNPPANAPGTQASPKVIVIDVPTFEMNTEAHGPNT